MENLQPQSAVHYDASKGWGAAVQPERLKAVMDHVEKGSQLLDLGTARGAYASELRRQGYQVIGMDVRRYGEWARAGNFVVGSATDLPFVDKVFHSTIAFEVLEHVSDLSRSLAEIARCTRDTLIFSVPNCDLNNALRRHDLALAHWTDPTHCNFFTRESLTAMLQENRFQVIEMTDCYPISPNAYYWNTIKLPRLISKTFKTVFDRLRLAERYWSSILVVAAIP